MRRTKAKPVPKAGQLWWTLLCERVRETTRGCLSANLCIKPLLVSSPLPTLAPLLCRDFVLKEKQNEVVVVIFPELPGVISLHTALWQSENLPYTSWLHTTGTQKPGIPLSVLPQSPHIECVVPKTHWQDGLLQKGSHQHQFCWEEDWRTSSLPTTEGSAQAFTWMINNICPLFVVFWG